MKIHLVRSADMNNKDFGAINDLLLSHTGPLSFIKNNRAIVIDGDTVSWKTIFDHCIKFRDENNIPTSDYIVLLMSKPNEHNWFSSVNPGGTREIFIHSGDWEYYIPGDPVFAIAFQIIENIFQSLMFRQFQPAYRAIFYS